MPNADIRFELEAKALSLRKIADVELRKKCEDILDSTLVGKLRKQVARATINAQGSTREEMILQQDYNTATQVAILRDIISKLFLCLEVFAESGIELSNEQLAIVHEFWAACLYSMIPDPNVYSLAAETIEQEFGLSYKGKIHDILLGRRFGKSFSMLLAMSCMVAVCPAFKCCVLNLFGHAGRTNYDYAVNFLSKLQRDPKKRINCKILLKSGGLYVEVRSHYQNIAIEFEKNTGRKYYVETTESNTLHSFPDMTKDDGVVRPAFSSFPAFPFVVLVHAVQFLVRVRVEDHGVDRKTKSIKKFITGSGPRGMSWIGEPVSVYRGPPPFTDTDTSILGLAWDPGVLVKAIIGAHIGCLLLSCIVLAVYEIIQWKQRTAFMAHVNAPQRPLQPPAASADADVELAVEKQQPSLGLYPFAITTDDRAPHFDKDAYLAIYDPVERYHVAETRPVQISSPYMQDLVKMLSCALLSVPREQRSKRIKSRESLKILLPYALTFESFNRTTFLWVSLTVVGLQLAFCNLLSICGLGSAYRNGYHPDFHPVELHQGETWWLKHVAFFFLVGQSCAALMSLLYGFSYWHYTLIPLVVHCVTCGALAVAASAIGGSTAIALFLCVLLLAIGTNAIIYLFLLPRVQHKVTMFAGTSKTLSLVWGSAFAKVKYYMEIQWAVIFVYVLFAATGSDGAGFIGEPATLAIRTACEFLLYATFFGVAIVASNLVENAVCRHMLMAFGVASKALVSVESRAAESVGGLYLPERFYAPQDVVTFAPAAGAQDKMESTAPEKHSVRAHSESKQSEANVPAGVASGRGGKKNRTLTSLIQHDGAKTGKS